jgi:nitroreductase
MDLRATDLRLHRTLLMRRSCRSFSSRPVTGEEVSALEHAVRAVPSVQGLRSGWAEVVSDPGRARSVTRAVISGLAGKINLWLARGHKPPVLVVCCGDPARSPVSDGRYLYNVDAALAGEAAVIAAAGRHLESVWMAGIGEREVVREMGLAEGQRVVAVIAVGHARTRRSLWDGLTQRVVSGRRRPLADVAFRERFGVPLAVEPPDPVKRREMLEHAGGPVRGKHPVRIPPPSTSFTGAPDEKMLRVLLDAARWAPNAENAQIWRFIAVRDEQRRRRVLVEAGVEEAARAGEFLLLACCAAPFIIDRRTTQQPFALIDVPIAALHVVLVAAEMGLGWNMLVDVDARAVAASLNVPQDHQVVCLMMLGRGASHELQGWQQLWMGEKSEKNG